MRTCFSALVLAGCCFFLAGCGKEQSLQQVTGKILHEGKPAVGAIVTFHPESSNDFGTVTSVGTAGEDGTYTLATGSSAGVPVGKYIVTVYYPDPKKKPTAKQKMEGATDFDAPEVFQKRYAERASSKLRAEVKAGEPTIPPFDLK